MSTGDVSQSNGDSSMRRNEALETAIAELNRHNKKFELKRKHDHFQILIENCRTVITVSETRALNAVRCDVRRAIRMG